MCERKTAWVYCAIDAPEDVHDALKRQRQQLMEYAEQMDFNVAGSSNDLGNYPLWERAGFRRFVNAVKAGNVKVLLIVNQNCLTHSSLQLALFAALAKSHDIQVYSPLAGLINI